MYKKGTFILLNGNFSLSKGLHYEVCFSIDPSI